MRCAGANSSRNVLNVTALLISNEGRLASIAELTGADTSITATRSSTTARLNSRAIRSMPSPRNSSDMNAITPLSTDLGRLGIVMFGKSICSIFIVVTMSPARSNVSRPNRSPSEGNSDAGDHAGGTAKPTMKPVPAGPLRTEKHAEPSRVVPDLALADRLNP
ncbi:hypothetical protein Y043_6353 [Burkholderia pseudomallei MSHR2138]|nr:hypothetical protein Y043_6353 [Burkholderia pseudomallei MSHR2138]